MATTARYTNNIGPINQGTDKTDRIFTNQFLQPVYAATLSIVPKESHTLVQPATLTGNVTINIGVGTSTTAPFVGDTIEFLFTPDGSTRTVTWGTGIQPTAATFAVTTAKLGYAKFVFNGTAWINTSAPTISA